MSGGARFRDARVGGSVSADIERRPDGVVWMRSTEALQPYPPRLADRLEHWAREAPDRTFVARRGANGEWRRISYAQMLDRVQRVGQALMQRTLSVERPIAILSENDLEHLTLALGAMWVGIPYTPVSSAYSLLSTDHAKLRHIFATTTPGLVFASGPAYAKAIAAVVGPDVEVVLTEGALEGRATTPFSALLATDAGDACAAAHAATGPDTIVKFLFTSGSTKDPKGVVNTNRMLSANQQMLRQCMAFLADEPPVLVDWLPWNHTFGGNHNVGITLYNGGTLYIDDGKPTPKGIAETLRNLREISPTIYFNVPKGFEEISVAMDHDDALRESLFRRVKAFMFAGAGLAQAVWDRLDRHAERTIGERIRVITGLGMTETAPSCTFAVGTDVQAGWIGLPAPGGRGQAGAAGRQDRDPLSRTERDAGLLARARADRRGLRRRRLLLHRRRRDASSIRPIPARASMFDGRIAEDFKLSSGTFVSVGPLRAKVLAHGSPLVQDSVVAGINRDDVGLLLFPRIDQCRKLSGLPADADARDVLAHPAVRDFFQRSRRPSLARRHRRRQPRGTRPSAARAAVDGNRRADRQGIDQSTRRVEAARGDRRSAVRRQRCARDPAAK